MVEKRIQVLADGSTRYRLVVDGSISPSGVYDAGTIAPDDIEGHRAAAAKINELAAALRAEEEPLAEEVLCGEVTKTGRVCGRSLPCRYH